MTRMLGKMMGIGRFIRCGCTLLGKLADEDAYYRVREYFTLTKVK